MLPPDPTLPSEWETAGSLLEAARSLRQRTGVLPPTLVWCDLEGRSGHSPVPHAKGRLVEALDDVLRELRRRHGPPSWFAVLVDAYGRLTDAAEEPGIEPEELSDRFAGGDPATVEQLIVILAVEDRVSTWRQVYRWLPTEGWEWDSPQWMARPVLSDGMLEMVSRHAAAGAT